MKMAIKVVINSYAFQDPMKIWCKVKIDIADIQEKPTLGKFVKPSILQANI
jgi:hypothetical protein